jgi:citrate lyase subunit beta/citryl-CoA lyase
MDMCKKVLKFYDIPNAEVEVEDSGTLPFVLAARLEAAIGQITPTHKEFLLPLLPQNRYRTTKDRYRRSRLYLPGNNPKLMINAGIYGSDGIILDLEDSVAPEKKQEAQKLVRNALCQVDFYGAERMVRINQVPQGLEDLKYVVPHHVNTILIPKCEHASQVHEVVSEIEKIAHSKDVGIHLMPIIESALGVEHAFEIAKASPHNVALAIGLEDYTADLGTQRTLEGKESLYARTRLVNAAAAADIQAIDSVFSDFEDMEALKENVIQSKALGFVGMGCIHPRQVAVINEGFSPGTREIEKAKKIVMAFHKASGEGKGVVAVGSKMIDPPVVKRALLTIDHAIATGKLDKAWRDNYEG